MTKERGWERVIEILEDGETLDFALLEVSNVVWKKAVLTKELSEEDVRRALTIIKEYLLQVVTISKSLDLLQRAMEISVKEGLPIYESLYIALAETKGSRLITGDRKQYEVAKRYVDAELL